MPTIALQVPCYSIYVCVLDLPAWFWIVADYASLKVQIVITESIYLCKFSLVFNINGFYYVSLMSIIASLSVFEIKKQNIFCYVINQHITYKLQLPDRPTERIGKLNASVQICQILVILKY